MAQTTYYFTAAAQLGSPDTPVGFSVPTGNLATFLPDMSPRKWVFPSPG